MPASMLPVVHTSTASPPADVSQANASSTGMANGKPFADTLSQQMDRHMSQSSTHTSRQQAAGVKENKGQSLASDKAASGKDLPPVQSNQNNPPVASGQARRSDELTADAGMALESQGQTQPKGVNDMLALLLQRNAAQAVKQQSTDVATATTTTTETAINQDTQNLQSSLQDMLQGLAAQGVDVNKLVSHSLKGEGKGAAVADVSNANVDASAGQDSKASDLNAQLMLLLNNLPVNALNLSDKQGNNALADLLGQGQGGAIGSSTQGLSQAVLQAMQMQAGSKFQLSGDFNGSAQVLAAQRDVMNMQSMFGKGSDGKPDNGVAGLFQMIALQKVGSAVNAAQQVMGDKQQFMQMLQSNLQGDNNARMLKLLSGDLGQQQSVLQAHGALLSTQTSTQGQTVVANVLTTSATLDHPLDKNGWDQALGERLQWMVKKDLQQAELKLNPRHLGPIDVKISMGPDQTTSVNFTAAHHMTKDAIEAAIPRLREMLGNNGMTQVDVNVSQHSFNQHQQQAHSDQGQHNSHGPAAVAFEHANEHSVLDAEVEDWHSMPLQRLNTRLLDTFA